MSVYEIVWIAVQIGVGYNLIFPLVLYLAWLLSKHPVTVDSPVVENLDYAIIVTAYGETGMLTTVVNSILKADYQNYLIYIVADNCDIEGLTFPDPRVCLLRPPQVLASNTRSHLYAMNHVKRVHDVVTIVDGDNLVHESYFKQLNIVFSKGFSAVQGTRAAKNLEGTIACLDAARDIYYHFYDGKVLFEIGSSATLAGSGMAFKFDLYRSFLNENEIIGAGFDKVLQSWLLLKEYRIAFNDKAIIFDQKTSRPDQLVQQRSRWINTWFRFSALGFKLLGAGLHKLNKNQILFGIVLLRPPLFLFLLGSLFFLGVNIVLGFNQYVTAWSIAFLLFILAFAIALVHGNADKRIYKSLVQIPKFVLYQLISLLNVRKANRVSIATKHLSDDAEGGLNK
jgi:cellulose synthase/poly-beta-1,6-N-acetylglucosamine synthase-like glycosyltransferase